MGQQPSTQNQQAEQGNNPEVAWWCRLLARIIGVIAGLVCFICAVFGFLTLKPRCIASAVLMLIASFIVLIFEAPICCQFIEITKPIGAWAEKRSYFQKGFLYAAMAIIPFALCVGLSTVFGCGSVFATGVFYGLMALGKKADRDQMMANAQNVESGNAGGVRTEAMDANLVKHEAKPVDNPFGQR